MADRFSNLPDEILCHILSFLPTEDAAATIVLSKRWRPLWPLVSALDFHDHGYLGRKKKKKKSYSSFINFVYAAILSRNSHQPIKKFSLICSDNCPYSDSKVWLNAALQARVENLEIDLSSSEVSCCILTCKTLVNLKLLDVNFDAFSSVDLPSLKTLHLNDVEFVKPQFLMDLIYGCPVLEDLQIHNVSFDESSFKGQVQSLSKLVRAEVFFYGDFYIPVKAFCNVQFLHLIQCDADIPVFPNLVYLELGYVKWSLALDMLDNCCKLQTIVFNLVDDDNEDWPYNPCFAPECFSSHLKKCFLKDYTGGECQRRFVRYVMQNSTSLRSMTICSAPNQNHQKKREMITELTSYPRSSAVCELSFDRLVIC